MKKNQLKIGIAIGVVIVAAIFSLPFVHFSSAQTATSSSSATFSDAMASSTTAGSTSSTASSSTSTEPTQSSSSSTSASSSSPVVATSTASTTIPSATSTIASTTPSTSTPSLSTSSLAVPITITAIAISPSEIELSWNGLTASSGIAGYNLYRGGSLVASIPSTSSRHIDKGLSSATPYTYTIAAVDAAGDSAAQSNATSTTTLTVPTAYPICGQTVLNVPGDYPTIQAAINAASIGDTIEIAAGTYNEDINLVSGICLEGAGIDQTIISKTGASGITGNNASYVIIEGLTVQNSGCAPGVCGGGGNGGGIQLFQSNNITIQSCRLTGNAAVDGGGISISQSTVTMSNCSIDNNTASNSGAGISTDAASTVSLTSVTVPNSD